VLPNGQPPQPSWPRGAPLVALAMLGVLLAMRLSYLRGRRRLGFALPLAVFVLYAVLQAVSCGGGGSGSGAGGGGQNGTPAGSYPLIINAISGSVQHQITVTLIVN